MGLTPVRAIPDEAVHEPDQDVKLPNGTTVEQFRLREPGGFDRVFEKFTSKAGEVKMFTIRPESQA